MICSSSAAGKSLAAIGEIFKNLQGIWNFRRELQSKLKSSPSGMVEGRATFSETPESSKLEDTKEYLYSEVGKFKLLDGTELSVSQQYFYQYNQIRNSIDVFFATSDNKRDRFFHSLSFEENHSDEYRATGKHLCGSDHYTANYIFPKKGLTTFGIEFEVSGPQKDYTASTHFTKIDNVNHTQSSG